MLCANAPIFHFGFHARQTMIQARLLSITCFRQQGDVLAFLRSGPFLFVKAGKNLPVLNMCIKFIKFQPNHHKSLQKYSAANQRYLLLKIRGPRDNLTTFGIFSNAVLSRCLEAAFRSNDNGGFLNR